MQRRTFLQCSAGASAALLSMPLARALGAQVKGERMAYGLVTYQWAKDWDLPTLLSNCEKAEVAGVELRTTHAHGVEPSLSEAERRMVQRRFESSPVRLVGLGSNERFDHPDPAALKQAMDATRAFLRLSHDVGGSGVKVKPDTFHPDIPREQTMAQIARCLLELADDAEGFGQEIRLEVHGKVSELPMIKSIMDQAKHPAVAVCWNSNANDLSEPGLEHNFKLVRDRFGSTVHVHELDDPKYPYAELAKLLKLTDYAGWVLLEAPGKPENRVEAMKKQREIWQGMVMG